LINFIVHIELAHKAILACGSMVHIDHFMGRFPRAARKTAHNENGKYRSAEGAARQLRKS
jgi:hypothetical protein